MDSFEFNKIAGAVLGTALFVMALSIVSEMIYEPEKAEKPGYVVAVTNVPHAGESTAPVEVKPITVRLASANVTAGEDVSKKCLACHTLLKDQPAKVGPNLWNVVGGPADHMASFHYSEAMQHARASGLTWTYENLDAFLASPKTLIPGTAMGFPGLPVPQERADVIAYLRTLADNPIPLPAVSEAAPASAPGAPTVTPNPEAPPRSAPLPPPAGAPATPAPR
jgi:cytochrome c